MGKGGKSKGKTAVTLPISVFQRMAALERKLTRSGRPRFGSVANGFYVWLKTAVSGFSGFYYFRFLRIPVLNQLQKNKKIQTRLSLEFRISRVLLKVCR